MKKAAFLGTGNMGGALVRAACRSIGGGEVLISNRTFAKAEALAAETGCTACESNAKAAEGARYVFLCVKPHLLHGLLREIAPVLTAGSVLVSIAAGVTCETIACWLAEENLSLPVLRVMPNTPSAIGKGMLALCAAEGVKEEHLAAVESILASAGLVRRIDEHLMDAFSAVAGCGPAFVYPFIEALADGGVLVGLPRADAVAYAAQTLMGAAAMVLESGQHPGKLKDDVCSPSGSTIRGVAALEDAGFRGAAIRAVTAAYERNLELGKQK